MRSDVGRRRVDAKAGHTNDKQNYDNELNVLEKTPRIDDSRF